VTGQSPLSPEETAVRVRGIALICLAVLCFAALDTCAKYAGRWVPAIEVAWARYFFNFIFVVVALRPWRSVAAFITRRPVLQIVRGLFLLCSTLFNFIAIRHLQLAITGSISFAGPLLATALAGPILGEWAGPRRIAAVCVGFIGVLIVIQPTPADFNPAAIFSILGALCYVGYSLSTRKLSKTDSATSMLLYGAAIGAVALTPAMPFTAVPPPDWTVAAALIGTGVAGSIGHWFLILAHRNAPPTVLAPFSYTQLIWMIVFGYLAFGDVPGAYTLIGGAIIVASGLYALYRERIRRDR
jgi:drug/metabolite transporter (DMT)-like permease